MIRSIQTGEPSQEIITYMTNEEYAKLFRDMIGRATKTIDIMANDSTALPLSLGELDDISGDGVKTRVLTKTTPKNLPHLTKIAGEDMVIAENAASTDLILLTIDAKEALMNVPYKDLQRRTVWSNINAYVETMILMFSDYWELGQPIQEKLKQVAQRIRVETLANKIGRTLEDEGWAVEVPGTLQGASKSYLFDVLARNPEKTGASLCIDVLSDGSVFDRIVERSSLHSDLKSARFVLASLIPCNSEELRLAELYQIQVVYAETEGGLVSSILKTLK
jgi:hypothetical protein